MQLIDDGRVLYVDDKYIENFKEYAIQIMTEERAADPDLAFCWNVCVISFRNTCPGFSYGGCLDDVGIPGGEQVFVVYHPEQLMEKKKRKKGK